MEVARRNLKEKYAGVLSDDDDSISEDEEKEISVLASPITVSQSHALEASGETCLEGITELVLRQGNFGGFDSVCIDALSQVEMLSLSNNQFQDCKCFSNFNNLVDLNVNFNQISSLEGLNAPKLRRLFISNNRLSSLEGVRGFPRLKELCVYSNRIMDLEDAVVRCRQSLPKLRALDLGGNPCSFGPAYRHTVVKTLFRLKQLDGEPIATLDKDLAALYFTEHSAPKINEDNRPTTAPAIMPGQGASQVGPETSDSRQDKAKIDPFAGFEKHDAIRGKVNLLSSTKLNNDPVVLSYIAEDVLSNQGAPMSKQDFLEGFKERQKNMARPATACIDTSKSFVSKLRGANANQPKPQADQGTAEVGMGPSGSSDTNLVSSPRHKQKGKTYSRSRSASLEDPHSRNPTPPPARQGGTVVRTRKRTSVLASPDSAYDDSEAVRPSETDPLAHRPASSEQAANRPSSADSGSLTARVKKAGQAAIDPSDPFATIQKLLKLIELLQAERSAPDEEDISDLKKEIVMLRLENQNMYALKEENRNLKNENKDLWEKLEQYRSANQQGITIGGWEDSQSWPDAAGLPQNEWERPTSSRGGSRGSSRGQLQGVSRGGPALGLTLEGIVVPQEEEGENAVSMASLLSARSTRPQTALDIINETEEVDIELAELLRVNQQSLQEIKQEMKETERILNKQDAKHRKQKKGTSTSKRNNKVSRKIQQAGENANDDVLHDSDPPSMIQLLQQRKVNQEREDEHHIYSSVNEKNSIPVSGKIDGKSGENDALIFSSGGDESTGEDSIVNPGKELLFAFTGELNSSILSEK